MQLREGSEHRGPLFLFHPGHREDRHPGGPGPA